jgi:hypothetical protein
MSAPNTAWTQYQQQQPYGQAWTQEQYPAYAYPGYGTPPPAAKPVKQASTKIQRLLYVIGIFFGLGLITSIAPVIVSSLTLIAIGIVWIVLGS